MTSFTLPKTKPPRAAKPEPSAAASRPGVFARIWSVLEQVGRRRARHQMDLLAAMYEHTRPDLARQLRAASREMLNG